MVFEQRPALLYLRATIWNLALDPLCQGDFHEKGPDF